MAANVIPVSKRKKKETPLCVSLLSLLFFSSVSLVVKQSLVQVRKTEALLQSTNRCFVLRLLFRASCLFVALPNCLFQYPCYRYTKERRRGKLGSKRRQTPSPKLSSLLSRWGPPSQSSLLFFLPRAETTWYQKVIKGYQVRVYE
jgi:hypothetical protein